MGRSPTPGLDGAVSRAKLTTLVDTNVWIRHLTGEPPDQARRATRLLASGQDLLLTDVVFAECAFVLDSVYAVDPGRVALLLRSLLALPSVWVRDAAVLDRSLELYEAGLTGYTDAYLVAVAELTGVGRIASFDRALRPQATVEVNEPA